MVSTLGAITGIAASVQDHFTVILAGFVIVSVESISMAVGSFLSSKSKRVIDERKIAEEKIEIKKFPKDEKNELFDMYVDDGWPKDLAAKMAEEAAKDEALLLKEMTYRELKVDTENFEKPFRNGSFMFFSYIAGGTIPLVPYLLFQMHLAIVISVVTTLIGLFFLGVATTRYSKRKWWLAGLEMLGLASVAAIVGYAVGQAVDNFFLQK